MNYGKPTTEAIVKLLEMIFGPEIDVTESKDSLEDNVNGATFIDKDNNLVAMCFSDMPFTAYSGAALSMIPAGVANDAVKEGQLTDMMKANFFEVMNICSKLMMRDGGPHLRLDKVLEKGETDAHKTGIEEHAKSFRFVVDIPSYGTGKIGFLVT